MKKLLFLLLLVLPILVKAQTADTIVAEARQSEQQMKEADALAKYKQALQLQPDNLDALVAASILCSREGVREKKKDQKEAYFKLAKVYADGALKQYPQSAQANYAMAMADFQAAQISGAKEKVAYLKDVKKYTDLAITLDSSFGQAYYLAGKWNMDIANASTFEKAAARMLFGGMPQASLDEALQDFLKCRHLDPHFIANYYELAQAWHQKGKDEQAIAVLKDGLAHRNILQDDAGIKADCRELLESLN